MIPFDFDLHLPEHGDAHVEFSASFSHFNREWELDTVTVTLCDTGIEDDEHDLNDLDESSKILIQARVSDMLREEMPSAETSARILAEIHADQDYHAHAEAAC